MPGSVTYVWPVPDVPAPAADSPSQDVSYTERLLVPIGWWMLTLLFALSLFIAVLSYLGLWIAIGAALLVCAVMSPLWIVYGHTRVVVAADRLWVGRANIEWQYLSGVRSLNAIQTRQRRGPEADARAYLALRPYLNKAVEITLCDPDDPTPYWLIGSRTPNRFANAVRARIPQRSATDTPDTDPTTSTGAMKSGGTTESCGETEPCGETGTSERSTAPDVPAAAGDAPGDERGADDPISAGDGETGPDPDTGRNHGNGPG